MAALSLYILRAHAAPFVFGTFTVVFIFLLQFLFKYIDRLVGKGLGFWLISELIALNIPWMLVLAVPMGVLASTLMAFGNLSATHEIAAMKAGGVSTWRLMRPVFAASIITFLWLFWFNDSVLPDANHRARILMDDIQQKRPLFALEPGQFSRLEGYSFLARRVDSASQVLYGLTIYDAKKANQTNVVNADSGTIAFSSDFSYVVVDLQSGEIHQMNKLDRGKHRVVSFSRHRILIPASGFQLSKSDEGSVSRGDREMSIADMTVVVGGHEASVRSADSVARYEAERHIAWVMGDSVDVQAIASPAISQRETMQRVEYRLRLISGLLDAEVYRRRASLESKNSYLVEIHKKYAIPFACVVFFLVGGPLGIITRRGNLGLSAALTLAFYTFYWACLMLGEDLADHGLIPAWLGMWGANGILAIAGILLIIRVTNENVVLSPWQLYLRRRARRLYASAKV